MGGQGGSGDDQWVTLIILNDALWAENICNNEGTMFDVHVFDTFTVSCTRSC